MVAVKRSRAIEQGGQTAVGPRRIDEGASPAAESADERCAERGASARARSERALMQKIGETS